jgi:hypothetical protein
MGQVRLDGSLADVQQFTYACGCRWRRDQVVETLRHNENLQRDETMPTNYSTSASSARSSAISERSCTPRPSSWETGSA